MTDPNPPPVPEPEEARPWERPGQVRRDCEPHRGALLDRLGGLSIVFGLLAMVSWAPAFLGLPLAFLVLIVARDDLAKMDAGRMDPDGRLQTERAQDHAWLGLLANTVFVFLCSPFVCSALGPILR
jgi:hypothetical protein